MSIALKNHVITIITHQILKTYLLLVHNYSICLQVYAETTLLKITDHHLKGQHA